MLQMSSIIIILLQSVFSGKVGSEMAHQLYKLQTLLLNMYEEKMLTPADPHSQVLKHTVSIYHSQIHVLVIRNK